MKNILLLTDFSKNARNAIDYALAFFKKEEHHFFLLYVEKSSGSALGDLMTSSPTSTVYDSIIKKPKAALAKMVKELDDEYRLENYSFEGTCDYDDFMSAVNQTVRLKGIDLIVMGTNGATGAKEVVFGSNTINVIRNIDCPVLAIPQGYTFTVPKSILFATDMGEEFTEKSLSPLIYTITKFDAEVQILSLETESHLEQIQDKKSKMDTFFKGFNHNFYSIANVPVDIAIDSFVQIKHADLTAKIINKVSFLKRVLSGSKTDEITYKSRVPLLIMHP